MEKIAKSLWWSKDGKITLKLVQWVQKASWRRIMLWMTMNVYRKEPRSKIIDLLLENRLFTIRNFAFSVETSFSLKPYYFEGCFVSQTFQYRMVIKSLNRALVLVWFFAKNCTHMDLHSTDSALFHFWRSSKLERRMQRHFNIIWSMKIKSKKVLKDINK